MRLVPLVLLVTLACSGGEQLPDTHGVLETNATSYVATPMTSGAYDYGIALVVKLRNGGQEFVRISRCLPTTSHPPYWVQKASNGADVAWSPNIACALEGPKIQDLHPGEERSDTLQLRAPWLRNFNGTPVGDIEGEFYLVYETRICRSVNANGSCNPINQTEYVRSNKFRITTQ